MSERIVFRLVPLPMVVLAFALQGLGVSAEEYLLGRSGLSPQEDNPLQPGKVYDGSNPDRVDEFFRKVPERSTIRLGAQTYETRGVWDNGLGNQTQGFRLKDGWTIVGQGTNEMTGTVMKLVDVPVDGSGLYNFNAVFSTGGVGLYTTQRPLKYRPNLNDLVVRDLQIDCNYPALVRSKGTAAMQLAGIQILGNRGIKLSNILVRNAASKKVDPQGQQLECFQVYLYNPWAGGGIGEYDLDRIAVSEYQGGYTSAICINGKARGRLQHCTVNLASDRSQRYALNFAAGLQHFTITDNLVLNATRGINNDTSPVCTDVTMANNRFINCSTGLFLANSQNNSVLSNSIALDGTGCGIAIQNHPALDFVCSGSCIVRGNTLTGTGGEGISLCYEDAASTGDLHLYWSSNNIIQNNIVAAALQSKIPPDALVPNLVRPGNRRELKNYPPCDRPGAQANLSGVGFPSDVGPGSGCTYCPCKAIDTRYGYIARVRLSGTRLDMTSDGDDSWGYSDYTTGYPLGVGTHKFERTYWVQWADLVRGRSYKLGVEAASLRDPRKAEFRVYIDWDHDGRFDPSAELVAAGSGRQSFNAALTVPRTAPLGSTRMRVLLGIGRVPAPCEFNRFLGEVEDYTINVVP